MTLPHLAKTVLLVIAVMSSLYVVPVLTRHWSWLGMPTRGLSPLPEPEKNGGLRMSRAPESAPLVPSVQGQIDALSVSLTEPDYALPQSLKQYSLYERSARESLKQLYEWTLKRGIELPLFQNRLLSPQEPVKICVAIATTRREYSPFQYLVQAVSALLNRMNYAAHKDDVYIHVFNVDAEPTNHVEADLIRPLVPVTDVKIPLNPPEGFKVQANYQENVDSAEIVRLVAGMGCQYPIFLEDDALATTDWVESVLLAITQLEKLPRDSWFMTRLFVARSFYSRLTKRGINDYDPGFNSVALLTNRQFLTEFAEELDANIELMFEKADWDIHLPIDHIAKRLAEQKKLKMLAFEPVVFQHTGIFSSITVRPVEVFEKNWIFTSKYFDAEGKPIEFNRNNWET